MTSLAQLQTACRLAGETLNLNEGEIDCTLGPWPTMVGVYFTTNSFVRYDDFSSRETTTKHLLTIYVDDAPTTSVLSDRIVQRISEVRPSERGGE